MDYKTPEQETTVFNSSRACLERLHYILIECNHLSRLSKINMNEPKYLKLWKETILTLYREISPKLNKKEKTNIRRAFNQYQKIKPLIITSKTPNGVIRTVSQLGFKQYWLLTDILERKLRRIADEKGMLLTNKDSVDSIIGDMGG